MLVAYKQALSWRCQMVIQMFQEYILSNVYKSKCQKNIMNIASTL